jgi:hypothetical protein
VGFEGAATAEPDGLWVPLCWNRMPRSALQSRCRRQMAVNAFSEERSRTWSAKTLDGWVGGSQNLRHLDAKWVVDNHTVLANPRTRQIVE